MSKNNLLKQDDEWTAPFNTIAWKAQERNFNKRNMYVNDKLLKAFTNCK